MFKEFFDFALRVVEGKVVFDRLDISLFVGLVFELDVTCGILRLFCDVFELSLLISGIRSIMKL